MKLSTGMAALAALALSGCATLLDSMTSLDEITASQEVILQRVEGALVDPSGITLPAQLARTEEAVARLAGGDKGGRTLADLAAALDQTNESVGGLKASLEGILQNTESLVWPAGEAPPGETAGGSILGGVHGSTSKLAGLVPGQPALTLLAGFLVGVVLALLIGRR